MMRDNWILGGWDWICRTTFMTSTGLRMAETDSFQKNMHREYKSTADNAAVFLRKWGINHWEIILLQHIYHHRALLPRFHQANYNYSSQYRQMNEAEPYSVQNENRLPQRVYPHSLWVTSSMGCLQSCLLDFINQFRDFGDFKMTWARFIEGENKLSIAALMPLLKAWDLCYEECSTITVSNYFALTIVSHFVLIFFSSIVVARIAFRTISTYLVLFPVDHLFRLLNVNSFNSKMDVLNELNKLLFNVNLNCRNNWNHTDEYDGFTSEKCQVKHLANTFLIRRFGCSFGMKRIKCWILFFDVWFLIKQ